ncbi:hypothetical protein LTR97_003544 [Elasticomyces elasticus]|uniref:BTB domain-containing protein n=1 Tax=Elasticomyces elasticus TaxID=574655 RepID=A0AAN8A2V4_9PEZI|nr:hypothetical protein LTR97_003544 [Elasticomyces elasticus]
MSDAHEDENEWSGSAQALAVSLQTDRLVDIYVGEITTESRPYRVQQVVLEKLSEYFVVALKRETFSEGPSGRLHFPDDDVDVWQVLLQWAIQRDVPHWEGIDEEIRISLLIRCWVTGDKYALHDFQNEIMLEALMCFCGPVEDEDVYLGVKLTAPGSAFRCLMAEEMVFKVYTEKEVEFTDLNKLDGTMFMGDFLSAKQILDEDNGAFSTRARFGTQAEAHIGTGPGGVWKKFMVGDRVPQRAWRWETGWNAWCF